MKYAAALFIALLMLALPACSMQTGSPVQAATSLPAASVSPSPLPSATTPEAAATPAALNESDLDFTLDGVAYKLKTDAKPLLGALGESYELTAAPSCLYVGEDKTFAYPDISISTFPIEDKDIIDEIDLLADRFATNRGIKIGDTLDQIKAAYGSDYTDDGVLVTYWLGGDSTNLKSPQLYFEMTDGKVSTIGLYSASNIQ